MKRLLTIAGLILLPVAAGAQTTVPPVPPPPRPAQAPPVPPTPVIVPPVIVPPVIDRMALEDAMRAAREAQQMDVEALREQALETAGAMDLGVVTADEVRAEMERAQEVTQDQRFAFAYDLQQRGGGTYSGALSLLQQRQYDRAITSFDRVIAAKDSHSDGALYWKAFAQFKLGKADEALATIAQLRKDFPQSRYLGDAKVLEADVRKSAGQPVNLASMDDDEIKVLAIQGIQNSDPERATPLLESVLSATNSLRVKKQALYVLALSDQPRAHQILLSYAKGSGNPELQAEAITRLASRGNKQTTSAELRDIYEATQDTAVKMSILNAYRSSGDKAALVTIASNTTVPIEIRSRALNNVSNLATPQELWTLYQKEPNAELRSQMVSVFSSMRAIDQLAQIAKTDKDAAVRQRAVRTLGSQKTETTGQMLVDMYGSTEDKDTRMAVISALSSQGNAEGLVSIARKESSLDLKTQIVRRLSDMAPKSKVAADYLMEIIKGA
jgi:HEAT repeat protein